MAGKAACHRLSKRRPGVENIKLESLGLSIDKKGDVTERNVYRAQRKFVRSKKIDLTKPGFGSRRETRRKSIVGKPRDQRNPLKPQFLRRRLLH